LVEVDCHPTKVVIYKQLKTWCLKFNNRNCIFITFSLLYQIDQAS